MPLEKDQSLAMPHQLPLCIALEEERLFSGLCIAGASVRHLHMDHLAQGDWLAKGSAVGFW